MNKKFIIVSDSCCDMDEKTRKLYDVEYIPMYISYDDKSLQADLDWKELSAKEFYDIMRGDTRIYTSQVTAFDYTERFEKYITEGYDILSLSCSSALSASIKASKVARDELKEKYPDAEIVCIDSLTCSYGLAILCILASKLRAEGKNIHEVAEELETIKTNVNQIGTVDELRYLQRAGRISSGTAFFGALMSIKPIIVSNTKGENVSVEKAKGRKNSIRRMAELTKEKYTGEKINEIFISHGDCLEEAETLKRIVSEQLPDVKITVGMLDPIVGASCGPKMLAVYFVGQAKPNTDNA